MSKHTAGPWRVGDSHLEITDADGHRAIAEVRDYDGWEEISEEEQEANLRLIAAAPDMLKALQMEEELNRIGLIRAENDFIEAVNKARRDAIAKAEGQS